MENKKGFIKGINGENSSKRLAGFLGLFGLIAIAIFAVINEPGQAASVMWPLATVCGACFGVTVLEKFKGGNNK